MIDVQIVFADVYLGKSLVWGGAVTPLLRLADDSCTRGYHIAVEFTGLSILDNPISSEGEISLRTLDRLP